MGTIILLDLPPNTFVGLDLLSFNSSATFRGVRDVPPGLHFVYTGTDASLSIRHGCWLSIEESRRDHVLKWNHHEESLVEIQKDGLRDFESWSKIESTLINYAAIEGATANLQSEDATSAQAGRHSPSNADWSNLTHWMSTKTISRITPSSTLTSISSSLVDTETIPGLTHSEAISALPSNSNLNFAPINLKQTWADGDMGIIRTDRARDRSWYLGQVMDAAAKEIGEEAARAKGANELLAELSISFLMVLTLANYSCLEQWKRLLSLFFTCRTALSETETYFVEVLKLLRLQLLHAEDVEGGLFELREESGSAWLRTLVRKFRGLVEDTVEDRAGPLHKELQRFEKAMDETYGWQLGRDWARRGMLQLEDGEMVEITMDGADEDDETGDWAPAVVET